MPATTSSTCGSATRADARSTARRATVTTSARRRHRLRRAGPGHRLLPVRAAGAGPRLGGLLRLPHARRPRRHPRAAEPPSSGRGRGREANGSSSAAACSGSRRPTRCGCSGLTPHVVEFAPRLMPLQVDEGGGAVLERLIERPRRRRCTPAPARSRSPAQDDGRLAVELSDGTALLDRPGRLLRRHPARATSWPAPPASTSASAAASSSTRPAAPPTQHVYAIGECAAVEGRCYGLVAPGYTMAEVVADRLLGGEATFPGADLSTKLKLLGVDVASFGDAHGARRRARSRSCTPTRPRAPTRSSSSPTTRSTLLGGILVGDASAYATLQAVRRPRGARRPGARSISPAGARARRRRAARRRRRSARATTSPRARSAAAIADGACDLGRDQGLHATPAPPAAAACRSVKKLLVELAASSCPRRSASTSRRAAAELFEIVAGDRHPHLLRADRAATARAPAARSASPRSPRSSPRRAATTSSTASRPRCRTPTTTSSPTSSATAPTRSCRGCPAARSRPSS